MKKYIVALLSFVALLGGGYSVLNNDVSVGGDAVTPIAGQTYVLAGSGISSSETSFTLTSFTVTQNGYKIQDSDMSDIFYVTFEPGSRSRQEIASCTTVTQNSDNTATISGCTRGLLPITPYTASTSLQFAHSGGSTVIFSDPPQLFNQTTFKSNDETITGSWLFPTPLADSNAATKLYVDTLVSGGTVSNDRLIVAGTAGETLATSTLVYFNPSTQRWNGVSSASTTTFTDRFIGLTQGAGTNGDAVSGGILLKGRHTLSTGLSAGSVYYTATATGTISVSTSSQPLGIAVSTDVLYFDPVLIDVVREGADNIFTGTNTFTGTTIGFGTASTTVYTTGTHTYTKSPRVKYAVIEVQAAGGNGSDANDTNQKAGGGGAGGYGRKLLAAANINATTSITVGAIGANTSFGTTVVCTSGTSAAINTTPGGAAGTCSGGDININGQQGGVGGGVTGFQSGHGGDSGLGIGGAQQGAAVGSAGTGYGAGGSGGGANDATDRAGGAGASGVVIVTEYF